MNFFLFNMNLYAFAKKTERWNFGGETVDSTVGHGISRIVFAKALQVGLEKKFALSLKKVSLLPCLPVTLVFGPLLPAPTAASACGWVLPRWV